MSGKSESSVESEGGSEIQFAQELIQQAKAEGISLAGPGGLLSRITKTVLEAALNAEMDSHLGYEKGEPAARGDGNHRNGSSEKTVHTDNGSVRIDVPRDRKSEFEPQQRRRTARELRCRVTRIV